MKTEMNTLVAIMGEFLCFLSNFEFKLIILRNGVSFLCGWRALG